ncbi:putative Ig domain-containing protein, partial [Geitlerinema sp. CS-897]|nr:putative Ig domain-containing protein [Geitlerinema sp. CS-897]
DPTVRLRGTDGVTDEGVPYYDFSDLVSEGALSPGGTSEAGTLEFYNPHGVQFDGELVVWSQLNRDPLITGDPETEVLLGKSYTASVVAEDPDGDVLSYELVEGPPGLSLDSETGELTWAEEALVEGNHTLRVRVEDGRGGVVEGSYILEAIEPPPNRPPIFTSTPVVEAYIQQPYVYDADAIDPDGDVLDYGVSYGPDGLTVDSETGVVNWTPSSSFILGDTVLGQIGVPGEQDSFTFNGTAGQRVYFDPRQYTGSASDWGLTVFDPDGKELLVTDLYSQRDDRLLTLLKNGEYRVVVDTNTDRTGSYGFSVLSLDLVPFVPFDTPIEGVLETGTQDAIYRFTGNAEQKLFIDNTTNSGNFKWVLYGPDNVAVESQFYGNDMELYLPEDGEYVLALQGKGNLSDRIEYAFEIVTPDEIEQPLQLGINANSHSVTGEIGEKGEEDIYTFEAEKGQRILFDRLFSTNSEIEATIFSPSDRNLKKSQFNRVEDYVPITFDETGTYRIVVDASGENTGSYRFSVLDANAAPSIAFDTLQSGRIDPGEETHLYQFNGEAEQRLFVDLPSSLSGENWKLYDSGNQKISSENWPSEDPEYVLPRKDTYTLAVVGKTSTPWDYEFEIVTPNLYEKTLALNTPVYGNLTEKGDRDVYTLTGYKGQILFLDALEGTSSHEITLTSPSGQTAYSSEDLIIRKYYSDYKDDRDRLLVRLPEDGVYELLVDGDLEQTGRYGFQLIDVSTAPKIESQTSLDGILDPGFSVQFYQFEGGTDETVYFDSLESVTSYSSYWYLYNSNLERIASRQLKNNFEIDLHGSGTYYLGILGGEETPLNYSIERVATVPETASIALDTPANGEIAHKGERDIYTFTGAIGQHIAFELLEGNSNLNYEIFSPSNRSFGSESVDDSERLPLTESGEYRVEIDGQDDTTGTYRFQIATVEDDFTPSPPVSAIPLALNTPRSISLAAGETKRYRFTGQIGQKIWFDGLTESDRGSNVYVTLYDPSGTEVFKNYNLYSDELLRTLTRDGNYDLVIESKRSSATEVSFQVLDNFGAASASFDSEVSGNLSNQLATQLYRFTGEKGQHLYLERLEGDYYNYVHLYAPDGRRIDYQRLSYDLGDFELPGNGEYILALQGNTRSNTQQYGFEIVTPPQLPIEPFEFGSLVSGEIAEPGQANVYTFEAESGQRLWFDGLESTNSYDPRGSLYDPQGARIWSGQSLGSDRKLFEVPTTGTYRLEIDASSDQTGEYRFRILDVDAEGDAHLISLDSTFDSTSKVGVEADPAATHIYGFDGTAGQVIYVDRLRGDDVYSIYDAAGQAVATSGTSSDIEEFEAVLPKDGRYSLVVEGRGTTADYEVRLGTPDFIESSYEFGQTIVGSISEAGERDTYTFEGAPGQLLYLDNLADSPSIKATVTSPSDRPIRTFNLSSNYDLEPVLLNELGTYTLEIDGDWEQQGDYSLRLLDLMAAPTVALDTEITGDFGESRRAADAYRFTGEADRTLFFDRLTGDSPNYYRLYDSAGNRLFWQSLNTDDETTLPRDGEYVLVFDGRNGTDNSYRLEIVTPEFPTFDLTLGETVTNELTEPGEQHTYTFTGKLGQTLFYHPLIDSSSSVEVSLLDDSGKELWNQWGAYNREPFTLTEDSTYQLVVDIEKDAVTNYGFQLFDLASSPELPLDIELSGDFGTSEREAILYQFENDTRTHLYFEATGESIDQYVLYAPDGTRVFSNRRLDLDIEQELTDEGTYTLALLGRGGTRNDYALTVRAATFDPLSLPFGQVVEGTLEGAGDRHIYEFTGRIGQSLFFDGLSADPSLTAKLLAPDGSALSSVDPDEDWSKPLTLTESGLYRLEIDGENTATGDYSFRLSDLSTVSPLPLGEPVSGTVLDSEVELYQIEGTAGQVLNFDWLSADSEAYWNLYDPGNRALTEFKKQSASLDFEAALPLDGRYTLAVASSGSGANEYSFEVTDISTEPIATSGLGTKIAGNLPSGETRTHRFTASAGMQVYFDSLVNNYIRTTLIAPDGTETFSISSSNDLYTINPVTLTQTGEYVVKVSPWSGEYGLQLLEFSQDASERIQIGQAVSGTTDGRAARVYNFDGQIGQRILLNGMTGQNVDAKLYTPNGEQVFSHDFYYSRDTNPYALELDGVYHLVISGENDSANDYQFQLLDLSAGREVKLRVPVEGSLPTGQYGDVYKIKGRADQRLYFDSLQGTWNSYWELYDPNYQSIERKSFNTDLEDVVLPEDGEYTLYLEGGTSASPLNYRFQVWADDDRPDIVTPGDGRTAAGGDGALFEFPVALEVADGNGGTAAQEYTIRLMPDPFNTAPEILSTPLTDFGLNQRFYEYQLETFDAEDDDLNYRLIDGPSGAVVTQDTGMLGWFPQDARAGETYGFKVEVSDGRGGRDVQEFEVTVQSATGAIRGAVFDDLNGNGYRDIDLVEGDSPNVLFVVDTSGSMGGRSVNWGDPNITLENFDNRPVSVQDLEWASIVALAEQMSAQGRGDDVKVGLMAFGSNALTDMDVETSGFQPFTSVTADRNGNDLADYREAIQNPRVGGASAVGSSEIAVAAGLADSLPDGETLNVIFMSDGFISIDAEAVASLREKSNVNVSAFAIGNTSNLGVMQLIDPDALQVSRTEDLLDIFGGWDASSSNEPLLENVTVYLDLDNDGQLDETEPQQKTQPNTTLSLVGDRDPYYFNFEGLLPGTYHVRQVVPNGRHETAPTTGSFVDTVTVTGGETFSHLFGLQDVGDPPNAAPEFQTTTPEDRLTAGEPWRYSALALDPDADAIAYDLPLAPEGAFVDAETGLVVWKPQAEQTGTFDFLLRVQDDRGARSIQAFQLTVEAPNQAPVFVTDDAAVPSPQVGKPFEFEFRAIDPEGDSIAYSLADSSSNRVTLDETGRLTWTPSSSELGPQELTLVARDDRGAETQQVFPLTVIEAQPNRPPQIAESPAPNTRAQVGVPYTYALPVRDPDGDTLTYRAIAPSPTGLEIDDTGRAIWIPTAEQFGRHDLAIEVEDAQGATELVTWTVDVTHQTGNSAPVVTSEPTLVATIEQPYRYRLEAIDPDGDALIWQLDDAPAGAVLDPLTGVLSWQPTETQLGDREFAVRVTDSRGSFSGQGFTVKVNGTNTPPAITS